MTDSNGVGGPRGGEIHPWPDLHQDALRLEEALLPELSRLERLAEKPRKNAEFVSGKAPVHFYVEAELRCDVTNIGSRLIPCRSSRETFSCHLPSIDINP